MVAFEIQRLAAFRFPSLAGRQNRMEACLVVGKNPNLLRTLEKSARLLLNASINKPSHFGRNKYRNIMSRN